ncbi:MAG: hypothetical protein HC884_05480 [Chloroflexaceae bacterium]|nr:hypothetical protein [Chloroflexaceae bacterium]
MRTSNLTTWPDPLLAVLAVLAGGMLLMLSIAGCAPLPSMAGERTSPTVLVAGLPSPTVTTPTPTASETVHLAEREPGAAWTERPPLFSEVTSFSLTPQKTAVAPPTWQPATHPSPALTLTVPTATATATGSNTAVIHMAMDTTTCHTMSRIGYDTRAGIVPALAPALPYGNDVRLVRGIGKIVIVDE